MAPLPAWKTGRSAPGFANGAHCGASEVWGYIIQNFFCYCLLSPPFPSQNENIPAAVSEESRSEGKVGFKAYKNYLAAGAHWLLIVFLILLNVAAQVNAGIYFVCGLSLVPLTLSIFTLITVFCSPLGFALKRGILGDRVVDFLVIVDMAESF